LHIPKNWRVDNKTNAFLGSVKVMNENLLVKYLMKKKNKFTKEAQAKLAMDAKESEKKNNQYTWKFRYEAGADINSYIQYFDSCGICYLFKKLGIQEITPALCTYDYDMAELGGTVLTRNHTLAEGSSCCDFYFQKKLI
jgi:hypothetical protein